VLLSGLDNKGCITGDPHYKIEHNGLLAFCGLFVIFFVCYFTNQQEKEKEKKKRKKEKRKKGKKKMIIT